MLRKAAVLSFFTLLFWVQTYSAEIELPEIPEATIKQIQPLMTFRFSVMSALKDSIAQICRNSIELSIKMEAAREPWQVKVTQRPPTIPSTAVNDYSQAPVFIILFGDSRTNLGLPMSRRYDPHTKELAYISGLASAFLYMHLAATTLGLASQWVSAVSTSYGHCMVKNLLGIPLELEVYDMMAVGYPDAEPTPRIVRDRNEMVHYDYCGEGVFRTDEAVRDFIFKIRNP